MLSSSRHYLGHIDVPPHPQGASRPQLRTPLADGDFTVCLYTFSNHSLSDPDALADICFDQCHWLREYTMDHAEVEVILGATD
jgi:hypothetical protein